MLDGRANQVILKSPAEIEQMRAAGRVVAETLQELAAMVRPGRRLSALNQHVVRKYERLGVVPTFVDYHGFPTPSVPP